MKTVTLEQVGAEELALPARVQEALGELVGSAREGLLALSVGVGLRPTDPTWSRERACTLRACLRMYSKRSAPSSPLRMVRSPSIREWWTSQR